VGHTYYTINRLDAADTTVPPAPLRGMTPLDAYEWVFGLGDVADRYVVTEWLLDDDGCGWAERMLSGSVFLACGEPKALDT
jgi:hypothetical protein